MTNVGNIGPMPPSKVATRDGAGEGCDVRAGNDAFHSILARLGHASAKGIASGAKGVKPESNEDRSDVGRDKGVAKALHAAKDRTTRQKVVPEPLLVEPSGAAAPVVADLPATEISAALTVGTPAVPGSKPDISPREPEAKAERANKARETGEAATKEDTPQIPSRIGPPSSPHGSDQVALRVAGSVPVGWRQAAADRDAPISAEKAAELGATTAPTIVIKASVVATETHFAPIAASAMPSGSKVATITSADERDDDELEEGPAIPTDDQRGDQATGSYDRARRPDSVRDLRPERSSPNSADRLVMLDAGSTQQATATDPSGLPRTTLASVVDAVVTTANRLESASATARAAAPPSAASGEVRTMTMRLDLPGHGAVSLRVSLKGNALSLNVTADRDDTAKRLRRDRDALTSSLRDNGYDTDIRAIDVGRPDAPPPSRDTTSVRDQNSATAGSGLGQPGDDQRPTEPRQQDRGGRPYRETDVPQETRHEKNKPDDNRGRGLYV